MRWQVTVKHQQTKLLISLCLQTSRTKAVYNNQHFVWRTDTQPGITTASFNIGSLLIHGIFSGAKSSHK